jgi:transposase
VLPQTKDYVARRTAEGKSSREIQRCLKRYIARKLYCALNASTLTAQTPAPPAAA